MKQKSNKNHNGCSQLKTSGLFRRTFRCGSVNKKEADNAEFYFWNTDRFNGFSGTFGFKWQFRWAWARHKISAGFEINIINFTSLGETRHKKRMRSQWSKLIRSRGGVKSRTRGLNFLIRSYFSNHEIIRHLYKQQKCNIGQLDIAKGWNNNGGTSQTIKK